LHDEFEAENFAPDNPAFVNARCHQISRSVLLRLEQRAPKNVSS
jgi:hypothetical protein